MPPSAISFMVVSKNLDLGAAAIQRGAAILFIGAFAEARGSARKCVGVHLRSPCQGIWRGMNNSIAIYLMQALFSINHNAVQQ